MYKQMNMFWINQFFITPNGVCWNSVSRTNTFTVITTILTFALYSKVFLKIDC